MTLPDITWNEHPIMSVGMKYEEVVKATLYMLKGIHTMVKAKAELIISNPTCSSPFKPWDGNSLWRC